MSESEESASGDDSENGGADPGNQSHGSDYETGDDDPEVLALAEMTIRDVSNFINECTPTDWLAHLPGPCSSRSMSSSRSSPTMLSPRWITYSTIHS